MGTSYGYTYLNLLDSLLQILLTFICRNKEKKGKRKALTAKFLRQGYRYLKVCKAFSKFDRRHSALVEKYSLQTLLQQGISQPDFYGVFVYRFRKSVGQSNFLELFRNLINRYKRVGYSLDIMRQTAWLVINPVIVGGYASLYNCTRTVRASDYMTASS